MKITALNQGRFSAVYHYTGNSRLKINSFPAEGKDVFQKSVSFKAQDEFEQEKFGSGEFKNNDEQEKKPSLKEVFSSYIADVLDDPRAENFFNRRPSMTIQEFNSYLDNNDAVSFNELLTSAGIDNTDKLANFRRILKLGNTRQIFRGYEAAALMFYAMLAVKTDLAGFGSLLLNLYNENCDINTMDKILTFLKSSGLKTMNEFEKKFPSLKEYFNNYKTDNDKLEAVKYLQQTYEKKLQMLEEAAEKDGGIKNFDAEKLYREQNDTIDIIYKKNNGADLEPLSSVLGGFIEFPKYKKNMPRIFKNELSTPIGALNFLKKLSECGIKTADPAKMSKESIISDYDADNVLLFRNETIDEIAQSCNIKRSEAEKSYNQLYDLYSVLYEHGNTSGINTLFSLGRNSSSILNLYKNYYGRQKENLTSITQQEFLNFIDDAGFFPAGRDVIKLAKRLQITPQEYVKKEKQNFYAAADEIKKFIENDTDNFFIGKSPLQIYHEYREYLTGSPEEISGILEKIKRLKPVLDKNSEMKSFNKFFNDKLSLLKFLEKNEITFDDNQKKFIDKCCSILSLCGSDERKFFTDTDFLKNSKNFFDRFYTEFKTEEQQKEILSLIAAKKVPSLKEMYKFAAKLTDAHGNYNNVPQSLQKAPENIDFEEFSNLILMLQKKIEEYNPDLRLDNENILNIDIKYLKQNKDIKDKNIAQFLNSITGAEDSGNFIFKLSEKNENGRTFAALKSSIANDIALAIEDDREKNQELSYKNILSKIIKNENLFSKTDSNSRYDYKEILEKNLPQEFIDFVNDNSWTEINGFYPDISMHARLRLIERFAFDNKTAAEDILTPETKVRLNNILKTIYSSMPESVTRTEKTGIRKGAFTAKFETEKDALTAVFQKDGRMITIYKS